MEKMEQADIEMINKIMNSEEIGYAYLYLRDKTGTKDFLISSTSENVACFIGTWIRQADKIVITDIADRPVMTIKGEEVEGLNRKMIERVKENLKVDCGEHRQMGILLAVSKKKSDQYFFQEEQAVTMMEIGIL